MGVDEIYTAEVRRQQELAIVKEEAAYEQIQAAGGCLTKVLPNIVMHHIQDCKAFCGGQLFLSNL